MYLSYHQNGALSEEQIAADIVEGKLSKSFGNLKKALDAKTDSDVFELYCAGLMQAGGFHVDLGNADENTVKASEGEPVALFGGKYAQNTVHNHIVNIQCFDVPVLPILQELGIRQTLHDPSLLKMYNLILLNVVARKSIIFIDQPDLEACALLLESMKRRQTFQTSYTRQVQEALNGSYNMNTV